MTAPHPAGAPVGVRRIMAVTLVAAAAVLAGCGIPAGGAKPIPRADVPFHLLEPGTAVTTTTGPPAVGVAETVFLVAPDQQHLVAVERDVPVPASLTDVLGALLEGPTSAEQAAGYSTFVSGNRTQVTASVTGGVATVNFSVNPVQVVGPQQTIAVAQIVYTVTQQPGINQVLFHIAGQAVGVPVANGTQASGPVSRFDYLPQYPV
ncbi:MAG: GerMN domain-containing protein [Acidimicrobiales bacterium]|nr:GerMN domain-containing protein [Acidimicrobiales bacterium]